MKGKQTDRIMSNLSNAIKRVKRTENRHQALVIKGNNEAVVENRPEWFFPRIHDPTDYAELYAHCRRLANTEIRRCGRSLPSVRHRYFHNSSCTSASVKRKSDALQTLLKERCLVRVQSSRRANQSQLAKAVSPIAPIGVKRNPNDEKETPIDIRQLLL